MAITRRNADLRLDDSGGFSLVEVLISMAILTIVIGSTLAGMSNMMNGMDNMMRREGDR